ncbi:MAG: glycoside hydrolase, partial [Lachnospiraceae bacterium]|nr:glycoside hydrolase [Lachnospiraceae bacterium]
MRCRYAKDDTENKVSMLIDERARNVDADTELKVSETEDSVRVGGGRIEAVVSKETFNLTWNDVKNEKLLLKEGKKEFIQIPVMKYTTGDEAPVIDRVKTVDGERNFIRNLKEVEDHKAWQGRLYFDFAEDEHIHGLGQAEEGVYDHRGHVKYLYQHNMRIPMPVFVSDKGYGMFFDCCSLMTFSDTENGSYLFFDTIPYLDYYIVAGDRVDDIIAGFRYLTGDAAMLPKWAYGYIQSKEQYYTADELVEVAEHYRKLGIPIDCVVQDWNTWEKDKWGNKILDPKRYGNMKECAEKLHEMNVHTMVSVWPNMNSGTENYDEFMAKGQMLNDLA